MRIKHSDSLYVPPPTNYESRWVAFVAAWLEKRNARDSKVGNRPVLDKSLFDWVPALEAAAPMIRREALAMLQIEQRLPAFHEIVPSVTDIGDQNWMTFMFLGYGVTSQANLERCPETAKALKKIPGLVTAFYSILAPGKHIPPHRGPYNGVLRAHLALIVPEPNEKCWIQVDDQVCHWHEGEVLLFDDSWEHRVQNDTDGYRVVLFIDFERPLYMPARFYNRSMLAISRFTPMIKAARAAQRAWEQGIGRRGGAFDGLR